MKKTLFIILLISCVTPAIAQSDYIVSICGNTEKTISQEKLLACPRIDVNRKGCKVISYTLSFKAGNAVNELYGNHNKFTLNMISAIKESYPKKIYIEKIIMTIEDGTKRSMPPMIINII